MVLLLPSEIFVADDGERHHRRLAGGLAADELDAGQPDDGQHGAWSRSGRTT
jgi:hypothetical protein